MNTKKKLNAAIIGCGAIHKMHAEGLVNNPFARLAAVADIDEQKAKSAADQYDCRFYTDYKEMLQNSEIDVVHICTPHYLHAPMAIEAMKAGKHVLVEKPVAMRTKDALEMAKTSRETGKRLGVCFQNRYNPSSERIKELLTSGQAGKVLGAKAFVTWFRDEKYYTESGWRGTWEKEGGGVLINQSIHTLDLLQWFLGEIESIKGNADTRLLEGIIEVEDTADALVKFKSGATALFYATNCYTANSPVSIEIICENAVMKLEKELTVTYSDGRSEQVSEVDKTTGKKGYWGQSHTVLITDYYNRLVGNEDFAIDAIEARKALRMIECIYESSKSRKFAKFE